MTKMETLSAVIILSAAIATPAFAQDLLRLDSHSGSKPQPVTSASKMRLKSSRYS